MSTKNIGLAEMIGKLREELQQAQQEGQGKALKFCVDEVDLELQFTVSRDIEGGGGVKFWVYNAEAKGSMGSETVQTLRLKLKPETAGGGSFQVTDQDTMPKD